MFGLMPFFLMAVCLVCAHFGVCGLGFGLDRIAGAGFFRFVLVFFVFLFLTESLILAQDERWRRA